MKIGKETEDTGRIPQSGAMGDWRNLAEAYDEGMLENPEINLKASISPINKVRKRSRQRDDELYYEMLEGPMTPEEVLILQESRKNLINALLPKKSIKFKSEEESADEELEAIPDEIKEGWENYEADEEWKPHEFLEEEADKESILRQIKRLSGRNIKTERTPGDRQSTKKRISKERRGRKAA